MNIKQFMAEPGRFTSLKDYATDNTGDISDKGEAKEWLKKYVEEMQVLQEKLYAGNSHAVLLIFQAMDGAGKDSTIEHVMSGVNPQGCQVYSFKQPSAEELDHEFLWRTAKRLPERGRIGIFNRSYYEEVLVTRVHPDLLIRQHLPDVETPESVDDKFWEHRYQSINEHEQHLHRNGTTIIKFFLNISKKEQATRFLKRIEQPDKNWKFSLADLEERKMWDHYQEAYEQMIRATSTSQAPWYIIPADKKWFMRLVVAEIILQRMRELDLKYPDLTTQQKADLKTGRDLLVQELS
ncbi:MAG: polyphosphate kinase 2 family protein [Bacteroidales bacterium]|nr:polyphosphate kinase 2 family protein [Bacteroidales bacterium]